MKRRAGIVDVKPRRVHRKPPERFSLADLSPTTGNVPVSDEYKVEWVKAKAELKRRKSSASLTDRSDTTDKGSLTSVISRFHTTDPSLCSSYSPLCLGESSTQSTGSPLPQLRQSANVHLSKDSPLKSTASSPQSPGILSHSAISQNSAEQTYLTSSFQRPSSLSVNLVSACNSATHPTAHHQAVSAVAKLNPSYNQLSSSTTVPCVDQTTINEETSGSNYDMDVPSIHPQKIKDLKRVTINLGDSVDADLQETPASDDVKSSAAALRNKYETGQQSVPVVEITLDSEEQKLLESTYMPATKGQKETEPIRSPDLNQMLERRKKK